MVRHAKKKGGFWGENLSYKTTQQTWLSRSLVASGAGCGHGGGVCPGFLKKMRKMVGFEVTAENDVDFGGKNPPVLGIWETFDTD